MRFFDADTVRAALDYPGCIVAVRRAMIDLSASARKQPLRQITEIAQNRMFALMPGMLDAAEGFGVKILTVFGDDARPGRSVHQGVVILFEPDSGAITCMGDAGEITHVRTACASAVATDALARSDARTLGLFGCGAQARSHLLAIPLVRPIDAVHVWGRDLAAAEAFAAWGRTQGLPVRAVADPREAAACDIVTTVTGSATPILHGAWIRRGTHVNLVGSSYAGPVECDRSLVQHSCYIVDSRRSALAAAAEFLDARGAGLVDDMHIVAEIGEVLGGTAIGRRTPEDVTVYKSLGHIVQDLAALAHVRDRIDRGYAIDGQDYAAATKVSAQEGDDYAPGRG